MHISVNTLILSLALVGCQSAGVMSSDAMESKRSHSVSDARQIALYTEMRTLWAEHMAWTYATVDAAYDNQLRYSRLSTGSCRIRRT